MAARRLDVEQHPSVAPPQVQVTAVYPGANALELAKALRTKMDALAAGLPPEIRWQVSYDTTKFVNASIELVLHTFVEAFLLVLVVVYLFPGRLRATIIPLIAIPVSIVGTLAGLLVATASRSTCSRCSAWCWPSASWSTTRSSS